MQWPPLRGPLPRQVLPRMVKQQGLENRCCSLGVLRHAALLSTIVACLDLVKESTKLLRHGEEDGMGGEGRRGMIEWGGDRTGISTDNKFVDNNFYHFIVPHK